MPTTLNRTPRSGHLKLLKALNLRREGTLPKLEVLNLSNTKFNDKTLYVISKNSIGLIGLWCHGYFRWNEWVGGWAMRPLFSVR